MVDILKQEETRPDSYPAVPPMSYSADITLDHAAIWQRIESYTAHRFVEREVIWTIEGCEDEDLRFPLTPVTSLTAKKWEAGAWVTVTLPDGPLGYVLPSDGTFRITAQVGAGPVPDVVSEAFMRLAEYWAEIKSPDSQIRGATEVSRDEGDVSMDVKRWANWSARSIDMSGAGDLLRPYRRA